LADKNGNVENKQKKSAPRKQVNNSNGKSAQNRQNAKNDGSSVNNKNRPVNVGARMNIREQTPAKRRTAKEIKKINPDSPEIKRTAKRAQGYKIKKKKKKINPVVVVNAILFFLIFTVIASIAAVTIYTSLTKTASPEFDRLWVKIDTDNKIEKADSLRVDVEKYFRDGVMYVNMTSIYEEFDFVMTGDSKKLRFISDIKKQENVCFVLGTPFAEVNGNMIMLKNNVIEDGENIYVPAEFFEEYVEGIEIILDEEKPTLCVVRQTEKNASGVYEECDITFTLKNNKYTPSLPEDELTIDEQAKTYFVELNVGA